MVVMKCEGKHTVELLLETLNHGSGKGLAFLPDIDQLSDLVLHIHETGEFSSAKIVTP